MTSSLLAALQGGIEATHGRPLVPLPPIIEAAENGEADTIIELLQDEKNKVDQKDSSGQTALMSACVNGFEECVKVLLEHNARINIKDDNGESALMKASSAGEVGIVELLFKTQLDINMRILVKSGAALMGGGDNLEVKRKILDTKDDEGVTPLMKACEEGELEVVQFLSENGATVGNKDDEGWTALMWACKSGKMELIEWLVQEHGQPVDFVTEKGETPLMKAAAWGYWDVCSFLIDNGAKVNICDLEYQTALMWAAANGHLGVVEVREQGREEKGKKGKGKREGKKKTNPQGLVKAGAKADLLSRSGKNCLMLACLMGKLDVAIYLLDFGLKVDLTDNDGQTSLFGAVQANSPQLCEHLLDRNASIEAHTCRGETPLICAASSQSTECAKLLINRKADLYKTDENGRSALDHAEGTLNSKLVDIFRQAIKNNPKKDDD